MPVQFAVLASGSQGNATLVQAGGVGTLLDLGLGPRALGTRLESVRSGWERIGSAILTHTHGDHVDEATLDHMARQRVILFCHEGHRVDLAERPGFQMLELAGLVRHFDDRPFLTPNGLRVEPVELRHDGPTFGFRVEAKPGRGARPVALGYVADTGSWSDLMAETLAEVDLLGVEFNHDVAMQRRSGRSVALIARNLGDRGHLSNEQGAGLLAAVLRQSGPAAVRHVVLLHLSQQCNRPNLALRAARASLRGEGRRASVHAARQATAHPDLLVTASRRRSVAAAGRPRVAGRSPTPDFRFPEDPVPGPAGDDA